MLETTKDTISDELQMLDVAKGDLEAFNQIKIGIGTGPFASPLGHYLINCLGSETVDYVRRC